MNFYKHHIGDYASATDHLSWDEDMAYTRLMRAYYRDEKPLPAELPKVYRLVRAQSRTQRIAIDSILAEFFTKLEDGWHNKRCDEEVTQAQSQAEINRKIASNRTRSVNGSSVESTNDSLSNRPPLQTPDSNIQNPLSNNHTHSEGAPASARGRGERKRREEPESDWVPPTEEQIRAGY